MEEEPSATRFKHEPLPDSTTHIRLLKIQDIDTNGHIICLLNAWPVEEAPDYYALSYTWGSPTPSRHISINGCVFAAGQNCVYALKQAYQSNASRYFWMDALCIDQSTTQEKSHQVGMMGQIYAGSKHVMACVGPHTADSMSLFRAIDKHRLLLAKIHRLTLVPAIEKAGYWTMPNLIQKSSRIGIQCLSSISPRQREMLAIRFIAFMNRPYFSRVWVLQELHLAPNTSLCCGTDRISFAYPLAMGILIDFWIKTFEEKSSLSKSVSGVAYECSTPPWFLRRQKSRLTLQEAFRNIEAQRGCLTLASGLRTRRPLVKVLDVMQSFQCADVRDRLFGILALLEWGDGELPVPDYEKSNEEVAQEVLYLFKTNPETGPIPWRTGDWHRRVFEIFQISQAIDPK